LHNFPAIGNDRFAGGRNTIHHNVNQD
jgi:hypothetical protein